MITLALSIALGVPAPLDDTWKTFLAKGDKDVVQAYASKRKSGGRFENHSRKIEYDQRRWGTNHPYTIPQRTRNGQFGILCASEETYGLMDTLDDDGHPTVMEGYTDAYEPLVVTKTPLLTVGAWKSYNESAMLFRYDYYYKVWKIVRCGNRFLTICHVQAFGLVPKQFVKTHTEEQFESEFKKAVEQDEAPCPPAPQVTVEYPAFGFGSQVQAPESSSSSQVLATIGIWRVQSGQCKVIHSPPTPTPCPPITGETPPPSQPAPPVTTAPNPFETPSSNISTPIGPTNSGVKNANGGGH